MKYIKQINNMKIYLDSVYNYTVKAPDGRNLEDRMTLEQAEDFCKETDDFIARKKIKK